MADLYPVKEQMLENVEKHYDSTRSVPRFLANSLVFFPVWRLSGAVREKTLTDCDGVLINNTMLFSPHTGNEGMQRVSLQPRSA